MSETNELRIAVIGAGPAGVYSSDIFLRQLGKLGEELGPVSYTHLRAHET